MKRSTSAVPARRSHRVRRSSTTTRGSRRLRPSGEEQVDDHDGDRHERVCGGERQVVRDADVAVDDVADELRVPDDLRRDVVAEGQGEREDRTATSAGNRSGSTTRTNVVPLRPPRSDEASSNERGDPLEPGVDRQDHVRQPEVREDEPGAGDRVARAAEPEGLEEPVEHPVLGEDDPPRVDLHEVARPERDEDRDDQQVPRARRDEARHRVRDREGEDRARDRHAPRPCRSSAARPSGRRAPRRSP